MMKLRNILTALLLLTVLLLAAVGCACEHDWQEASCSTPRLCKLCGEIEGTPTGHVWTDASCSAPKTCENCGKTDGTTLPHTWQEATCTLAKTCEVCGVTEGTPNPHKMLAATCTTPATCSVCGASDGEPLAHSYESKVETVATCRYDGRIRYTCTECRHSYEETYAAPKYAAEDLYRVVADSVCEITVKNKKGEQIGLGTGFVYRANGLIVTNYHVIEHAYSATVTIGEKTYAAQRLAGYDKDKDIAVLKIVAEGLKPLPVCGLSVPTGTQVYALGSSLGLTATFTRGIITQGEREVGGVRYLQHDAAISPGNSGGPLLNEYGEVIGINALYIEGGQNLNFSVFAGELQTMDLSGDTALTDFYYAENDPVEKLAEYARAYGSEVGTTLEAMIDMTIDAETMAVYGCSVVYDLEDDSVVLAVAVTPITTEATELKMFYLYLPERQPTYTWVYLNMLSSDDNIQGIVGEVKAREFTEETKALKSSESEGLGTLAVERFEEEAAYVLQYLLDTVGELMAESFGGSVDMLGFNNYG